MEWRQAFGKAKKGVRQESVTISHAQRPPSADAADLTAPPRHRPRDDDDDGDDDGDNDEDDTNDVA